MKRILVITLLAYCVELQAVTPLNKAEAERIADAIYIIEGGKNTKFPYGIKSIKTTNPRQVCINTIVNNYARWIKKDSPGEFLDYLADVYCPKSADEIGNKRWKINIRKYVKNPS